MTARTRLLVLFVTAPVIVFALVGGVLGKAWTREEVYQDLRVFDDVVSLISSNYVEDVDLSKVMRGAMRGLAEGLDPDSAYLTPEEVRRLEAGEKLPPAGIGVELTRQYYLRVIAARDGSPAAKAGLRAGDFVRAVNGKPTREMSVHEGMALLRGQPGTKVSLLVIRGNAAEPHPVELVREVTSGPEVTGRLEGSVGYLRVASFGAGVAAALAAKAGELSKAGATSLALDVRDTATGALDAGLDAARVFVPSGTLALKETKGSGREPVTSGGSASVIALPAVVLVNDGTSGAAELFAAALAGNQRAELVGERTQGRAAVQKLVRLPDGAGMLISNTWYLTPSGDPIHEKGLVPGVAVEVPEVEFGAAPASDPILQKALERLRK
jgi:carboxyl-terminal processing protease